MEGTVIEPLEKAARSRGSEPAMRVKRDGTWHTTDWRSYRDQVFQAASGFIELGLEPQHGVAILGYNRPEWFVADLGAIVAGGFPAGIYTTCTPEQCHYIAHHCEANVIVVEDSDQLAKILSVRDRLPDLRAVVLMDGDSDEEGVYTWSELMDRGAAAGEARAQARLAAQSPDDLCTLIYTSGTTGPPKAVMLSHFNLRWTVDTVIESFDFRPGDNFLSYLPLSHIAEQMISLHGALNINACSWFAESVERMPANLLEVRPHIFLGVPRVWEKIQAAIEAAGAGSPPLRRRLVGWARRKGLEGGYAFQHGRPQPAFHGLAKRLVHDKVRQKLGLDRARVCATSAAPISIDTLEFFLSLGIPLLEVYGMSECTGPTTLCTPNRYRTGRAGFEIRGTELRIADDGEICMRGPHVFMGYYKDEAATREALDEDGWLHSGDIGEMDEDGFLKVTDRKKELLITSGGKNVAPQPIESKLKAIPGVSLAAVVGDGRKYLSALLTLDPERVAAAAEAAGSPARDAEAASVCEVFQAYVEKQVERVNESLASFETLKRIRLLAADFSVDGGELTPTMKLKRRVIVDKYADEIEGLYA